MKEKEFEGICFRMLEGDVKTEEISYVINNLFYERLGMSYQEILRQISYDNF